MVGKRRGGCYSIHNDKNANESSQGQSFNDIDRISLRNCLNQHDKRIPQSNQHEQNINVSQPFSSFYYVKTYLLLGFNAANNQRMCKSSMCILGMISHKKSKSVDKSILAVLITKAEIFFHSTEQKFMILFHLVQRLTNINALPHRYHLSRNMSSYFCSVPSRSIMIALYRKFNLASTLLQLLMYIEDMIVAVHVFKIWPKRNTAQSAQEVDYVCDYDWQDNEHGLDQFIASELNHNKNSSENKHQSVAEYPKVSFTWFFGECFDLGASFFIKVSEVKGSSIQCFGSHSVQGLNFLLVILMKTVVDLHHGCVIAAGEIVGGYVVQFSIIDLVWKYWASVGLDVSIKIRSH